ncbi:secondary metabolite protein [Streptomyces sp. NPDC096310]|uniref:secondary metabolite protein n=1 Tax=Streptomyces sp. NPDC096310 TaxID=3366082 RepID=UPI00382D1AEF
MDEICDQLALKRGRPLHLHELPDLGSVNAPCGLMIAFDVSDHIFHVAATSERHRAQIVRHELAHLLLGHTSENTGIVESLQSIMPQGVAPEAVLTALGRTSYDSETEYDAELAASYLGGLFEELAHPGPANAMTRLDDALGHPRRNRRS